MKKKVIIYGNCHTTRIILYLQNCREFNDIYDIVPIPPIQVIYREGVRALNAIPFDECDIFIHQSIQKNNRYGIEFSSLEVIKRLKSNCRIIAIPNLYHMPMFMFPQYANGKEFKFKETTCFFRDDLLDRVYAKNGTLKETVQVYCDPTIYSDVCLDTLWCEFLGKVKKREMEWDIKISDFLLENKSKHLFYDPNHPTNMVLDYVAECLFQELDIESPTSLKRNLNFRLDAYEMPICKSVQSHFNICEMPSAIRHSGRKVYFGKMDLLKYILQYWSLEWQNEELTKEQREKLQYVFKTHEKKKNYR